ncbi:MAG: hypothetical protein N3B01_08090, partial [Verrucomicrobiae bacterium]|nr:hypothetical protein [Verrucomicrobiae bacterium]
MLHGRKRDGRARPSRSTIKDNRRTGGTPVQQPTALEIALAELERLRRENLPVEEFYTRLSGVVRQFI